MGSSLDCSEMVESRKVFCFLCLAQLLLLLSEVDSCTKTQDTTDNHEDVRSHISLGSVCTNHPRSTDIHPCSGSSVGKDQGNKVVAVERVVSGQVMLKER